LHKPPQKLVERHVQAELGFKLFLAFVHAISTLYVNRPSMPQNNSFMRGLGFMSPRLNRHVIS
jgi:hypothetical protein